MPRARRSDDSNGDGLTGRIGAIISKERIGRGLKLGDLAQRASISAGLLSQLERGIGNPSIETMANIARALDLPIGTFFDGPEDPGEEVVHRSTRRRLVLSKRKLTYELLVPDLHGALSMLYIELPPHFTNKHAPFSHPGEEALLVQEGSVALHLGERTYHLDEGDSMRFAASTNHWYETADAPVVIISAMTPPSF